jgi:1,4-alpha-glucan branching enzyme
LNDTRPEGFEWIESNDAEAGVYAWVRKGAATDPMVVCVVNMTPVERSYRLGLPAGGHWSEILNTDAALYAGGNRGNLGGVTAEDVAHHGRAQSALVTLPPLAAVWLKQG